MRGIQLEYVFTKAFQGDSFTDPSLLSELETLKSKYRGEEVGNCALLHGDLHPGSVMCALDPEITVKAIDPEFTIWGPPGLDLGSLLSGFALAAVFHAGRPAGVAAAVRIAALTRAVERMWMAYSDVAKAEGVDDAILTQIECDAAGFAGCEVMRTALGCAGVRGFNFEDAELKKKAETIAVEMGRRLIMQRQGDTCGIALLLGELDVLAQTTNSSFNYEEAPK